MPKLVVTFDSQPNHGPMSVVIDPQPGVAEITDAEARDIASLLAGSDLIQNYYDNDPVSTVDIVVTDIQREVTLEP